MTDRVVRSCDPGGRCNETTGDYDGPACVDAARPCDAAEPRQVLCTDLVSRASRAFGADDFGPPMTMTLKGLGAVEVREFVRRASDRAPTGLTISVLGPLRVERGHRELEIEGRKERRALAVLAAAAGDVVGAATDSCWVATRSTPRASSGWRTRRTTTSPPVMRYARAVPSTTRLLCGAARPSTSTSTPNAARGKPGGSRNFVSSHSRISRRLDWNSARRPRSRPNSRASWQNPWRERLWANLMLALYRTGRQAEALRTFQRARTALVDELGVEPGPELRHLEAAILEHDPALLTSQPGVAAPTRRLPAALDPGGSVLVGRTAESALLQAAWERAAAGAGAFVAVVGPEGVGKTRLVAELAVDAFNGGAVVLHARCDAADRGPEALLDRALRGAGARLADMEGDTETFSGETVTRFLTGWSAGRPVLLVLDDLHHGDTATVEALADFAEWSASAAVLVVSTFRSDEDDGVESGPGRIVLRALPRDAVWAIAKMYRADWADVEIDELAVVS